MINHFIARNAIEPTGKTEAVLSVQRQFLPSHQKHLVRQIFCGLAPRHFQRNETINRIKIAVVQSGKSLGIAFFSSRNKRFFVVCHNRTSSRAVRYPRYCYPLYTEHTKSATFLNVGTSS